MTQVKIKNNFKSNLKIKPKSNLVFLSWTELCLFLISCHLVAQRPYQFFQVVKQLTHIDQCTITDQRALPSAVK